MLLGLQKGKKRANYVEHCPANAQGPLDSLGYGPEPRLLTSYTPAVWELPEPRFHHQLERSCLGLPMQSYSQSPALSTQLKEPQLRTRRMILLGQKMVEVVSSPQHNSQHGHLCIIPAESRKDPTASHDTGSSFLSTTRRMAH